MFQEKKDDKDKIGVEKVESMQGRLSTRIITP